MPSATPEAPDAGTHHGLDGAGMPVTLTIGHVMQLRDGHIATVDAFIEEQAARQFACA